MEAALDRIKEEEVFQEFYSKYEEQRDEAVKKGDKIE